MTVMYHEITIDPINAPMYMDILVKYGAQDMREFPEDDGESTLRFAADSFETMQYLKAVLVGITNTLAWLE